MMVSSAGFQIQIGNQHCIDLCQLIPTIASDLDDLRTHIWFRIDSISNAFIFAN